MLVHIRVVGPEHDLAGLRDYADIVAAPTADGAVLSCRVPDRAGLTGVVALLGDLGIAIADLQVVADPGPPDGDDTRRYGGRDAGA
ncbi:hypothetical protein [Cellulomonas sp. NPDC058312]|jgi:hypothetical protein|uniref:hypothetical protein n=1 Tax=Cellulomonas sp. NPDC058312 TaxID=3346441 RepID=UPI0036DFCF37